MAAKARKDDEDRIAQILDAAQAVFVARGFSGATTDEIARVAQASKTTLYALFGSKEALFRDLMARRLAPPDPAAFALDASRPPQEAIRCFVLGVLRSVTSPEAAALVRIAIAEAARFPELRKIMAERLRYDGLAAYLKACRRKGLMAFKDADAASAMLVAMAQGDWTVRALYGLAEDSTPAKLEAHATLATEMFLAAVRPPIHAKA